MPAELAEAGVESIRTVLTDRDPEWDDDETIDQVLRLVADHHRVLGAMIGRRTFSPTIAELRQSPLGRDLRLLANGGTADASVDGVRRAAERVADVLLRPLAADDTTVPPWFWGTAIGRMVARAEITSRGAGAFLTLAEAADRLAVDHETLLAWVAAGALTALPDRESGWLVPRREVERRHLVRLEFSVDGLNRAEDVVVAERRLAS